MPHFVTWSMSLLSSFTLRANDTRFTLTNVYAPTDRADKPLFFSELASIADSTTGAWMLIGDFNLTHCPEDKNTAGFNSSEANNFNDLINAHGLIEIPLTDRAYTWTSRREDPTLVRLDRCFINLDWDSVFPNTSLRSLTRYASDHVRLLATADTRVPRSACFRFENSWLHHRALPHLVLSALSEHAAGPIAKSFVRRLKHYRRLCRS